MTSSLRTAALLPFLLAAAGAAPAAPPHAPENAPPRAPIAGPSLGVVRDDDVLAPAPPAKFVGPYRLIRELGAGGMGVVHLAESVEPVRRRVALKIVREGRYSPTLLSQFEIERQALAELEHPNVARYYDGGATPEGRPWFAMEYVQGEPLLEYCDRRSLDVDARLQLFASVANAVEHMHARGVLHGDLKPDNILVSERDGEATPKIVDLGLARLRNRSPGETDLVMGTPAYMAPEQFQLTPREPDERCDVFALGVVLRELLVGKAPNEAKNGWLGAALRSTFEPAVAPSERLAELGDAAPAIARRRGSRVGELRRRLRGTLDGVVLRATEREPERRIASARELAKALDAERERRTTLARWRRTAAWSAAAAVAGLAAGLAIAL